MTVYRIDTRADTAVLAYADGSVCDEWEIAGDPTEPERLTMTAHGVELVTVIVDADGSITIDVHPELEMKEQ